MDKKQNVLKLVGAIILILLVCIVVYMAVQKKDYKTVDTSNTASSTQITEIAPGISVIGDTGGATITIGKASSTPSIKVPDLDRLVISANLSKEVQDTIISRIKTISASLKKDSLKFADWIDLGINRKILGDYEGARQAWEYASAISSTNIVSFSNLGDLYHYYLKNYSAAEKNLKQVIANDATYVVGYKNLFDLYHLSYMKDTSKAENTLLQGLKIAPTNIDLLVTLGSYYKEKGRVSEAKTAFEKALAEAVRLKDTNLQAILQTEIDALK